MKNFLLRLAVFTALLAMLLPVFGASCLPPVDTGGDIVIIVGEQRFELENVEHEFIGQVLDELAATEELVFSYNANPLLGREVLSLGSLSAGYRTFVAIYISILEPRWSNTFSSREADGVGFYSANYGIDGLPVLDGVIYLFALGSW